MSELCRRTLLQGVAATCLLSACGSGEQAETAAPPSRRAAPGGGLRASLTALSDVPVGGAVSACAPDGSKVLVARPAEGEVVAFSAVCPHQGCTVEPGDDGFACPCHGSQFELDGALKRGPARTGLSAFPVRVVDGQVLPA